MRAPPVERAVIGARNLVKLSEHFTLDEFESPDTGEVMLDGRLFLALDTCRTLTGVPLKITSGYRTAAHNKAVGGKRESLHRSGAAADVVVEDAGQRAKVLAWLRGYPLVLVIDEGDHLHVQVRFERIATGKVVR